LPLGRRSDRSKESTRAPGGPWLSHCTYRSTATSGPSA